MITAQQGNHDPEDFEAATRKLILDANSQYEQGRRMAARTLRDAASRAVSVRMEQLKHPPSMRSVGRYHVLISEFWKTREVGKRDFVWMRSLCAKQGPTPGQMQCAVKLILKILERIEHNADARKERPRQRFSRQQPEVVE